MPYAQWAREPEPPRRRESVLTAAARPQLSDTAMATLAAMIGACFGGAWLRRELGGEFEVRLPVVMSRVVRRGSGGRGGRTPVRLAGSGARFQGCAAIGAACPARRPGRAAGRIRTAGSPASGGWARGAAAPRGRRSESAGPRAGGPSRWVQVAYFVPGFVGVALLFLVHLELHMRPRQPAARETAGAHRHSAERRPRQWGLFV